MIKNRVIIIPNNASDPPASDPPAVPQDFLDAFNIKSAGDPPAGDPPAGDPPEGDPPAGDPPRGDPSKGDPSKGDPPVGDPPAGNPPEGDPPKTSPAPDTKMAQAFASMRIQNKKYESLLKGVADILGVDNLDKPEELVRVLQTKINEAQAKKQNISVELLNEINALKEESAASKAERLQAAALLGFQKVMTDFKLNQAELTDFANTLFADGINPFQEEVDVVKEYKLRNFEKLMADAKEAGIKEEQARAAKAAAHGSTPGKANGQTGGEPAKINSVAQLTSYFNTLK